MLQKAVYKCETRILGVNLLSDRNYEESKKWGVTFKKVPQKSWFFWCLDLLNWDGKLTKMKKFREEILKEI